MMVVGREYVMLMGDLTGSTDVYLYICLCVTVLTRLPGSPGSPLSPF